MKAWLALVIWMGLNQSGAFASENEFIYWGAGGEPDGETTIFDSGLRELSKATLANSPRWGTTVFADGGHGVTQKIIRDEIRPVRTTGVGDALHWDFSKNLLERRIQSGELKEGDQIILVIDTHGGSRHEPAITHSIFTNDNQPYLLDRLKRLTELAEKKGIRLGIVDLSCHSGNTLALANSKTCVITAAGPDQYADNDFSETFYRNLRRGKSLEDVFLESRDKNKTPSFPMISTPQGRVANQLLYERFLPLSHWNTEDYKTPDLLARQLSREAACKQPPQHMAELLRSIEEWKGRLGSLMPDTTELESRVKAYEDFRTEMIRKLKQWGLGSPQMNGRYSLGEIVGTPWDQKLKELQPLIDREQDSVRKARLLGYLAIYRTAQKQKEELIRKRPQLRSFLADYNNTLNKLQMTSKFAEAIGVEERKLYQVIYRQESETAPRSNPCKDIQI